MGRALKVPEANHCEIGIVEVKELEVASFIVVKEDILVNLQVHQVEPGQILALLLIQYGDIVAPLVLLLEVNVAGELV